MRVFFIAEADTFGNLDTFTSRATAQLGLPYDIAAYSSITLVDTKADGPLFIHRDGVVSRFFLVRGSTLWCFSFLLPQQVGSLIADAAAKSYDKLALCRPVMSLHG
jgi:hypothetical protein